MKSKSILFNSSALFIIAAILEMTLHEMGHFFTAVALHVKDAELFHNYVSHNVNLVPPRTNMLITAAGPIVSLLIGIIFHVICTRYKQRDLLFLFYLYMSFFGYIGFFGYLMIAPFAPYGDTGYIFHAFNFPMWLIILFALVGVAFIILMIQKAGPYFVEMGTTELFESKKGKQQFGNALIKYPLFIGIVITTLLNLPVPTFLSLIAPICMPMPLMSCYGKLFSKKLPAKPQNSSLVALEKISPGVIVALVLIVVVNRLLVFGFHF